MKHLVIITCIAVIFSVSYCCEVSAQEDDDLKKTEKKEIELRELRSQIEAQRKKIKELEKRERNESEYLRKLQSEAALTNKLLQALEEKKGMLEEQSEDLRADLLQNEAVYEERSRILANRLREIYKNGPRHIWAEILEARDFSDLLQRSKFISLIAERDADLVTDVKKKREEIQEQEARITEILFEVTRSRNEKKDELDNLQDNEKKRKKSIEKLKSDKSKYEKKIAELAKAEKKMQEFIEEIERVRIEQSTAWGEYGEKDFDSLKGKLERPVSGEVVKRFGKFRHPEFGTVTYNTGIDIETRPGEPVRAVGRGRVEFSGVLPGYGNCIIVNHGEGYYSLYAHIAEVFVDQGNQIEKGDLIAETLDQGDGMKGALHFEVRKSKKALDPEEWLVKGGR